MNTTQKQLVQVTFLLFSMITMATANIKLLSVGTSLSIASLVVTNPIERRQRKKAEREAATTAETAHKEKLSKAEELLKKAEETANKLVTEAEETAQQRLEIAAKEIEEQITSVNTEIEEIVNNVVAQKDAEIAELNQLLEHRLDELKLCKSHVAELKYENEQLSAPKIPSSSDAATLLVKILCEFFQNHRNPVDYVNHWFDGTYVMVDVVPRTGGLRTLAKYANEIELRLALIETPQFQTIAGRVRIALRPMPVEPETAGDADCFAKQPTIDPDSLSVDEEQSDIVQRLNNAWTHQAQATVNSGWVEPIRAVAAIGVITDVERKWVEYRYAQGNSKQEILSVVYGVAPTSRSQTAMQAKLRYDQIIKDLKQARLGEF